MWSRKHIASVMGVALVASSVFAVRGLAIGEAGEAVAGVHEHSSESRQLAQGAPVSEIRGSMTLREITRSFGVSPADLLREAKLPTDVSLDLSLRDLKDTLGFEVETVRLAVTNLLNPPEATVLSLDDDGLDGAVAESESSHPTPVEPGAPGSEIRGSMTLREIAAAYDLAPASLVKAAKLPEDIALDVTLRELKEVIAGLTVETIRVAVFSLVG